MLRATQSQTSVTSLRFIDDTHVAAGCGSFLKIYDWRTSQLVYSRKIFTLNKIHGIEKSDANTLSIWGGNELVVVSSNTKDTLQHSVLSDRIVHVHSFAGTLYILTAHNEVHTLGGSDGGHRYLCDERSILYSGALFITAHSKLVAAGTVFGGVVVWDLNSQQIIHRFEQHEGSIFDVAWNSDGSELASCSDDRAIIVSNLKSGNTVAKGWGHISRIWKLQFVDDKHLVSAAEDCSVRLWEKPPTAVSDEVSELACTRILTGHRGKSVWSIDVFEGIAVSGGGDGRIMLWDLHPSSSEMKWNTNDEFGSTGVRSCVILSTESNFKEGTTPCSPDVAITTSAGQTYLLHDGKWRQIGNNLGSVATVKSYGSILYSISASGNGLAYNSKTGELRVFQLGYFILDFFVLASDLLLVVPIPPSRDLILTSLDPSTPAKFLKLPDQVAQPTCAMLTPWSQICIGTRKGELVVYLAEQQSASAVLGKALGTDAITSLHLMEHSGNAGTNQSNDAILFATNRTSELGAFRINTLERLLKTRSRKKGSIEGQYMHSQGQLLWGFQNDTFVAWNASLGFELFAIQCGGAHRSWSFEVLGNTSVFVYVRAAELHIHTLASPSSRFIDPLLQHGTHGREIRGMETSPTNKMLVATASEDTTVNVGWIEKDYQLVKPKITITDGHISGIQVLHWHPNGKHLFTGAGQGELVMWEVLTIGSEIFVNEASRMPVKRTVQQELRVMDFAFFNEYVAVAYSDSSFRIWRLNDEADNKKQKTMWELLAESKYRECCLLNIDLIQWKETLWLLMSSTDGHLVGYRIEDNTVSGLKLIDRFEPNFRFMIHQSSVRTSTLVVDEANDRLVHYSGGDDNAVHGIELRAPCEGTNKVEMRELFHLKNAHASAVTGIVAKDNYFVTVGSDQKLKIWSQVGQLLAAAYTGVSDTGDLVVQDNRIITGGIGIEFFEYSI